MQRRNWRLDSGLFGRMVQFPEMQHVRDVGQWEWAPVPVKLERLPRVRLAEPHVFEIVNKVIESDPKQPQGA